MEKQTITIGNFVKGFSKLEYDQLYYTKAIQQGINDSLDGLNFQPELAKCVDFVYGNASVITFIIKVINKHIYKFQDEDIAEKNIFEYTKKYFPKINEEDFSIISKDRMVEGLIQDIIKQEFLALKPLMKDIEKKIYKSINK
jgi:hypothetical protein